MTHSEEAQNRPSAERQTGVEVDKPDQEMSSAQNSLLSELGHNLHATASTASLTALMAFIAIFATLWFGHAAWAVLPLLVGLYLTWVSRETRRAACEFDEVVHSSGHDISHLMEALRHIHRLYRIKIYLLMVLLALALLLAFAGPTA